METRKHAIHSSNVRTSKERPRLERDICIKTFCWQYQQREKVERRISKDIRVSENKEWPKKGEDTRVTYCPYSWEKGCLKNVGSMLGIIELFSREKGSYFRILVSPEVDCERYRGVHIRSWFLGQLSLLWGLLPGPWSLVLSSEGLILTMWLTSGYSVDINQSAW